MQDGRLPVNRYVLFFGLMLTGLMVDLWTKSYMFTHYFDPALASQLQPQPVGLWWIDGVFGVQTSTNPGALFGLGKGYSWLFAIFSVIALISIFTWLFIFRAAFDRWLTFALGLISGGILGNLYDRVGLGALATYPDHIKDNVRDWILFRVEGGWSMFDPWPNFNIADALLVTGAAMLFLHALCAPMPEPKKDESVDLAAGELSPEQ